jgi:quinoprotein glucose dehydrogenase
MPSSLPGRPYFSALVFFLVGLVLAAGGVWLVSLGGSPYYLIAGAGLVATGVLLYRRSIAALWLYGVVLIGTVVWAIAEVGFDGWSLEPRLVAPLVLGLWLLLPWVRKSLITRDPAAPAARFAPAAPGIAALVAIVVLIGGFLQPVGVQGTATAQALPGQVDDSVPASDWQFYGRTPKGDRFSPLDQINAGNIDKLQVAWTTQTGDTMRPGEDIGGTDAGHEFNFEATPIKVGDTVYVCTGHSWVEALDAKTGKIKWKFDPKADTNPDVYLACRGVAYYQAPEGKAKVCQTRILSPVLDARVVALDAQTGKPCEDFGQHGFIDLKQYLGHVPAGFHFVTSPPLVLHDRMILGGWVYDNQARGEPSGAIRAFDPISGQIAWAWDVGHPDQVVHPGDGTVLTRGTPNAWGVYTADPDLNMVYLPLGNATPDYYGGGRRPFDNEYNSSIVALDITTGQPKWHFQTTHHDVWDMDLPIGPSLVDLPMGGKMVKALVQTSKRGEFWVLDRTTGQPIVKTIEKPVPTDGVPGENLSPTQSYPVGMPSLTPANLVEHHLWGATPIDQMMCRIQFRQAHYEGQFTPPQLRKTIVYPAFDGVIDWHGASIDPARKLLIANANYIPFMVEMKPRGPFVKSGKVPDWDGSGNEPNTHGVAPQYGTPYVGMVHPWLNPLGVPCNPPPWGTLTAIDLTTKKIVWQHALGDTRATGLFGTHTNLPMKTGIFNIGGNMITAGGLVFIGATADDMFRAIDVNTGKTLWSQRLPAGGNATPMSYSVDGKQYVLIAAGGHGGLGTKTGDYLVAYALPGK